MSATGKSFREMVHEFFRLYPDYALCRTLAANVEEHVTSYAEAREHLARKARAWEMNRVEIEEKLNARTVQVEGCAVLIRDLSLRRIIDQDDDTLARIVRFYFKHPYAHGRTWRSRFLPNWVRTFFLRSLLGNAKMRKLDLEYGEYFDVLTLL